MASIGRLEYYKLMLSAHNFLCLENNHQNTNIIIVQRLWAITTSWTGLPLWNINFCNVDFFLHLSQTSLSGNLTLSIRARVLKTWLTGLDSEYQGESLKTWLTGLAYPARTHSLTMCVLVGSMLLTFSVFSIIFS